jgi:hypothetical protein
MWVKFSQIQIAKFELVMITLFKSNKHLSAMTFNFWIISNKDPVYNRFNQAFIIIIIALWTIFFRSKIRVLTL